MYMYIYIYAQRNAHISRTHLTQLASKLCHGIEVLKSTGCLSSANSEMPSPDRDVISQDQTSRAEQSRH